MKLSASQIRTILAHPAGWIASGIGSGLSPYAPGTMGSLAALLPYLWMRQLPMLEYLGIVALTFAVGVLASRVMIARLQLQDPGFIVIDEFVGLWLALLFAPHDWRWIIVGFVLFRVFDISKPWPVSWADRQIHGGLGVMLDDAIAGAMAAATLWILVRWLG